MSIQRLLVGFLIGIFVIAFPLEASFYTLEEFLEQLERSQDKELHILLGRVTDVGAKQDDPLSPFVQQKLLKILPVRSTVPVILGQTNFLLHHSRQQLEFIPDPLTKFLIDQRGKPERKLNYRLLSLDQINMQSLAHQAGEIFERSNFKRKPTLSKNYADKFLAVEELIPEFSHSNSFDDIRTVLRHSKGYTIRVTIVDGDHNSFKKLNSIFASLESLGEGYFEKVEVNFIISGALGAAGFYLMYFPGIEEKFNWIYMQANFSTERELIPLAEFKSRHSYYGLKELYLSTLDRYAALLSSALTYENRLKLSSNKDHGFVVDYANPKSKDLIHADQLLYQEGVGIEIDRVSSADDVNQSTWNIWVKDTVHVGIEYNLVVVTKSRHVKIPAFRLPCGTGYLFSFETSIKNISGIEVETRVGKYFFPVADLQKNNKIAIGQIDFMPMLPMHVFEDYERKLIDTEVNRVFKADKLGQKFLYFLQSNGLSFVETILSLASTNQILSSFKLDCSKVFQLKNGSFSFSAEEIASIERLRTKMKQFANSVYTQSKNVRLKFEMNRN